MNLLAGLSRDARRLLGLFERLDADQRRTLLEFAEFLAGRTAAAQVPARAPEPPPEPLAIPRPEGETVVGAMKRLRRSYPMLDPDQLLDEASGLMSAHLLGGRPAVEVIDDLEALFARHYQQFLQKTTK